MARIPTPPPLPDDSEGMEKSEETIGRAKVIGLPTAYSENDGFSQEPGSGVTSLREFAAEQAAKAAKQLEAEGLIAAEDGSDIPAMEWTPEVHAEYAADCEADLDAYDEFDDDEQDDDAVLMYDENGDPVQIAGYIPGLTPHPVDVRVALPTIGSVQSSEINPAARADMEEDARHHGRMRVLAEVFRLHPSGVLWQGKEDFSDSGLEARMKLAANFLLNNLNDDHIDEDNAFSLVAQALLHVWKSKWKEHLDDATVQQVTNLLLTEDTNVNDLYTALRAINLSRNYADFDALMKVSEYADDFGNAKRAKGKRTNTSAHNFLDRVNDWKKDPDQHQVSFGAYIFAMGIAESWLEAEMLFRIVQLDSGSSSSGIEQVAKKVALDVKKQSALANLGCIKEKMLGVDDSTLKKNYELYVKTLFIISQCKTFNDAVRLIVKLNTKYKVADKENSEIVVTQANARDFGIDT